MTDYAIIYIWKMLKGLIPNFGIECYINIRTGRSCIVPKLTFITSQFRARYSSSLEFKGLQLFDALLQRLRNPHKVEVNFFKKKLDIISKVPVEPTAQHEVQKNVKESNSFIHQMSQQLQRRYIQEQ